MEWLWKLLGFNPTDSQVIRGGERFDSPTPTPTQQQAQPTQAPTATPTSTPSAMPTPIPDRYTKEDIAETIKKGYREWSNIDRSGKDDWKVPMIEKADVFAEQIYKNPYLKRHPFLLPVLSILETSGGQHMAFENNPLNWGIQQQKKGQFSPASIDETIEKAASGIASRMPAYQEFRETGDIADLTKRYAPPTENQTDKYTQDLGTLMKVFEKQLGN